MQDLQTSGLAMSRSVIVIKLVIFDLDGVLIDSKQTPITKHLTHALGEEYAISI